MVEVSAVAHSRLEAIAADRNSPQKHVWRARIVLLTGQGLGTGRDYAPHRQEQNLRLALAGTIHGRRVDGLLRDKTRPSRIPPLGSQVAERVIALTQSDPLGEATHWTGAAMAEPPGSACPRCSEFGARMGCKPHRVRRFKLSTDPDVGTPRPRSPAR